MAGSGQSQAGQEGEDKDDGKRGEGGQGSHHPGASCQGDCGGVKKGNKVL